MWDRLPIVAAILDAAMPSEGKEAEPITIWITGCPALFMIGTFSNVIPPVEFCDNAIISFMNLLLALIVSCAEYPRYQYFVILVGT